MSQSPGILVLGRRRWEHAAGHGHAVENHWLMAHDQPPVTDAEVDAQRRTANETRLKSLSAEDAKQLYDQVCVNVRTTDDISFKLLGLVPLVSGVGITVLLSKDISSFSLPILVFVGIFGAVVTFALYRWELKNTHLCLWLIRLGSDLERHHFGLTQGQFLDRPPEPAFLGWRISKRTAEKIIYSAAIVAWILLPVVSLIS
jgi:hypothetical protein